jgi:hypothetical protein
MASKKPILPMHSSSIFQYLIPKLSFKKYIALRSSIQVETHVKVGKNTKGDKYEKVCC